MNISKYSIILLLLILFACGDDTNQPASKADEKTSDTLPITTVIDFPDVEKQKIITMTCNADSSVTYMLYVPKNYDEQKSAPVILFFDSHAEGELPISQYSSLADEFNIVIAASNNSKNGMSMDENTRFGSLILSDMKTKINTNNKRIYTSGFSGGSRVAAGMAIYKGGINSVIGIAAGLPNLEKQIEHHFNYFGIVGTHDFNYNEMLKLDSLFSKTGIEHALLTYEGKHQWPPMDIMRDAFTWLSFKAMKEQLIEKNDSLVKKYITQKLEEINTTQKQSNLEAYNKALLLQNYISGIEKLEVLNTIINSIETKTEQYKNEVKKMNEIKIAEPIFKDQYLNALAVKDVNWWKAEVPRLNKLCKQKSKAEAAMIQRTLGFLSLACYMNTQQTIKAGQIYEAEHYAQIYKVIDPTNAEAPYLLCNIYLALNKNTEALSELKQAIKLGFNDFGRAKIDLKALNAGDDFLKLMK